MQNPSTFGYEATPVSLSPSEVSPTGTTPGSAPCLKVEKISSPNFPTSQDGEVIIGSSTRDENGEKELSSSLCTQVSSSSGFKTSTPKASAAFSDQPSSSSGPLVAWRSFDVVTIDHDVPEESENSMSLVVYHQSQDQDDGKLAVSYYAYCTFY